MFFCIFYFFLLFLFISVFYYFLLLKMINNKGKNSSTVFEIILCRLGENFYQFPHFQNQTRWISFRESIFFYLLLCHLWICNIKDYWGKLKPAQRYKENLKANCKLMSHNVRCCTLKLNNNWKVERQSLVYLQSPDLEI